MGDEMLIGEGVSMLKILERKQKEPSEESSEIASRSVSPELT